MNPDFPSNHDAPAKYVRVDDEAQRLARIWQNVSEHGGPQPRVSPWQQWLGWRGAWVLAAALALVFVGSTVLSPSEAPSALQGAALETATDALKVDLEDGSALQLSAHTRVEVEESSTELVKVGLSKGRVECNVAKDPKRDFVVMAHGVRVRVTGTRFSVQVTPDGKRVEVDVQSGSVEVHPPGNGDRSHRLGPGERWSYDLDAPPASTPVAEAVPDTAPNEPPALDADDARTDVSADERKPGSSADEGQEPRQPNPKGALTDESDVTQQPAGAKELFERANDARRAGEAAAAAKYYEQLLNQHPNDSRAGLAAFELGRLRMDRLGNLRGAVSALKRAVALAPGAAFKEDAMARLVQAHAAMGAGDSCRRAKKAYAAAYPSGVHGAALERLCP